MDAVLFKRRTHGSARRERDCSSGSVALTTLTVASKATAAADADSEVGDMAVTSRETRVASCLRDERQRATADAALAAFHAE
jgi:hypothetical protein